VSVTTTVDPARKKTPAYKEGGDTCTTAAGEKAQGRVARGEGIEEVEGWNRVEVVVKGDSAVHIVNGKVAARLSGAKAPDASGALTKLEKGRIGFQAEGYEIVYRNIEIRALGPDEK